MKIRHRSALTNRRDESVVTTREQMKRVSEGPTQRARPWQQQHQKQQQQQSSKRGEILHVFNTGDNHHDDSDPTRAVSCLFPLFVSAAATVVVTGEKGEENDTAKNLLLPRMEKTTNDCGALSFLCNADILSSLSLSSSSWKEIPETVRQYLTSLLTTTTASSASTSTTTSTMQGERRHGRKRKRRHASEDRGAASADEDLSCRYIIAASIYLFCQCCPYWRPCNNCNRFDSENSSNDNQNDNQNKIPNEKMLENLPSIFHSIFLDSKVEAESKAKCEGPEQRNGGKTKKENPNSDDHDDDDEVWNEFVSSFETTSRGILHRSWKIVSSALTTSSFSVPRSSLWSCSHWIQWVQRVAQSLQVVMVDHPLHAYATHTVPLLETNEERQQVLMTLSFPTQLSTQTPDSCNMTRMHTKERQQGRLESSNLALMKYLQEQYPPRPYGVILWNMADKAPFPLQHSCLPTARLELQRRHSHDKLCHNDPIDSYYQLVLTALYDDTCRCNNHHETSQSTTIAASPFIIPTISMLYGHESSELTVEQRDVLLQRRYAGTEGSCSCLLCRFQCQLDNDDDEDISDNDSNLEALQNFIQQKQQHVPNDNNVNAVSDLHALGRHFLNSAQLTAARACYERARDLEPSNMDWWHALGAIELSIGKFVRAQRLWNKAQKYNRQEEEQEEHDKSTVMGDVSESNHSRLEHEGMRLQWTKLEAYGYLKDTPPPPPPQQSSTQHPAEQSLLLEENGCGASFSQVVVPGAFVMPGCLDKSVCRTVIEWAETLGQWTQERHYAVPTMDVPVHTVQPLLDWFQSFFHVTMRPTLARQFGTSTNYYIHDAFCVKYQAGNQTSNHLPIHTDESTHSFVVALNDCDDDYTGGGTYFYQHDRTVRLHTGDVLSFRGDSLQHGGEAVTSGTRYILAVFLYHDDDDSNDDGGGAKGAKDAVLNAADEKHETEAAAHGVPIESSAPSHGLANMFRSLRNRNSIKNETSESVPSSAAVTPFSFGFQV